MIYDVDAVYDRGIFRPVTPLGLADGARVHLRVEEENGECRKAPEQPASYEAWLESLAGRWQGNFERGKEGGWPEDFFDSIRIGDPGFARPPQGSVPS